MCEPDRRPEAALPREAVFETLAEALVVADAAGRVVDFNDGCLGYYRCKDRGEWVRAAAEWDRFFDIRLPDGRPARREDMAITRALAGETGTNVQYRLNRKDSGESWWGSYNFSPIRDATGSIVGAVIAAREITEMKAAEKRLQDSEARLRAIVDGSPDAIYLKDRESRLLVANPVVLAAIGRPAEAVIGRTDAEFLPNPDDGRVIMANDRRIMESGRAEVLEEMVVTDAGLRCFLNNKAPFRDAAGEVVGLIGVARDVTEAKRAAAALRESEERKALLLKLSDALRPLADAAEIESAAARLLGEALQADRVFFGPVDPEAGEFSIGSEYIRGGGPSRAGHYSQESFPQLIETLMSGADFIVSDAQHSSSFSEETRKRYAELDFAAVLTVPLIKAGKLAWRLTATSRTPRAWTKQEADLVREVGERCWDAVQRARAEAALQDSEERFRTSFAHASIGFSMASPDGRVLDANPAFCAITGYSLSELREHASRPLIHPDDQAADMALQEVMIAGRIPGYVVENRYVRKGGDTIWVRKSVSAVRGADGAPRWLISLVEDITARVEATEALREADRRKDEFLATLAHELRNPLAPIRSGLEVLKLAGGDGAKAAQVRDMMARQVDHLVRIVDDLLEVSRASRGLIELRQSRIDLGEAVSDAVAVCRPLIDERRHRLTVSLPPAPVALDADPTRLAQVLINLINNAAKFTEPGGQIRISARTEDGEAVVSVEDDGVGIPADALQRVFDLFTRIETNSDTMQSGLGVGLTLARRLVDMHGGRIEARSEGPGRGSQFIVRLPLARSDPAEAEPSDAPQSATPTRRVLVVDDDHDVADSLAMLLEYLDMDVRVAHAGATALGIAADFEPEIVFLDLGMPKMDGFETARRLRQLPNGPNMILLALTGWGQADDRRRTRDAGFDDHLTKPVDVDLLTQVLARRRG